MRFPLAQPIVPLPEQMSQSVVVYYDEELRAIFKVTPSMLYYRFTHGQSLQIVRKVSVATFTLI
jgi:hypothetical protein